eukprot:CAMPEP_0168385736 /NCGR_PEP_ID=MMETSP0228-20121227/15071_1 /TAXON_ID=133427 /ORGANISM="Protoceratium reticulatum, Strain CCCM 535 (=CCMP 1889)" /LENGTH=547 /DNA_ID=CAMNT_0008398925 /DNA_START=20 /DNA_END=1660 /DNA_ORIENTATION=-
MTGAEEFKDGTGSSLPAWLPEHEWQEVHQRLRTSMDEMLQRHLVDQEKALLQCLQMAWQRVETATNYFKPDRDLFDGNGSILMCQKAKPMDCPTSRHDSAFGAMEPLTEDSNNHNGRNLMQSATAMIRFDPTTTASGRASTSSRASQRHIGRQSQAAMLSEELKHELFKQCPQCLTRGPQGGCVAKVLSHPTYDLLVMLVIFVHFAFTIFSTNRGIAEERAELTHTEMRVEHSFLAFYTAEIVVRFYVHRFLFFVAEHWEWNMLDFILVIVGFVSLGADSGRQSGFARVARTFKVAKTLRMLKVLRRSKKLKMLLDVLSGCVFALFWSLMLLCFFLCLFSIFFVQSVTDAISAGEAEAAALATLKEAFSSVPDGMLSLLMAISGGEDWNWLYTPLDSTGSGNGLMFLAFVIFFTFAALNIVNSLFVDRAVQGATPGLIDAIMHQEIEDKRVAAKVLEVISDLAEDDFVLRSAFRLALQDPTLRDAFRGLGLSFQDPDLFFDVVVQGLEDSNIVELSVFVQRCVSLRGQSFNLHLQALATQRKQADFE